MLTMKIFFLFPENFKNVCFIVEFPYKIMISNDKKTKYFQKLKSMRFQDSKKFRENQIVF